MERIRPRLPDLGDVGDDDDHDFADYAQGFTPAANVTRAAAPQVGTADAAAKSKPKSRFAQRRDAQKQTEGQGNVAVDENTTRFQLDLDSPSPATTKQSKPFRNGLLKDITEKSVSSVDFKTRASQSTGFPMAKRRVPTAAAASTSRHNVNHPSVSPSDSLVPEEARLLAEIDAENQQKLQGMSEAEILQEQKELLEMLGEDMASFLKTRGNLADGHQTVDHDRTGTQSDAGSSSTSALPFVRSPGKAVRFNEKVSYSNPPSRSPSPPPARRIIPLPAPPASAESQAHSTSQESTSSREKEEGDPESIREKYFPLEPLNSRLDWMKASYSDDLATPVSEEDTEGHLRFSLSGEVLSSPSSYRTSEGHRHAGSGEALSFEELLDLSKSAVTGQRVLAFQVLLKIFSRFSDTDSEACRLLTSSDNVTAVTTCCARGLVDKSLGVVTAALALLKEYASLGRTRANTAAAVLTVQPAPLESFSYLLSTRFELPQLSALTCLDTLLALLGTQEDFVSAEIVECPYLLENIARRFLQVQWPPALGTIMPEPRVAALFAQVISKSRANAESLITRRIEQSTLRFIAIKPWEVSEELVDLAFDLAAGTLQIMIEYGRYGLGCSACTTSSAIIRDLEEYVEEHPMTHRQFTKAWLDLLEVWATCAIDPHTTTPEHDIVWPEVKDWGRHLCKLLPSIDSNAEEHLSLARRLVSALVAWVEGALKHDRAIYDIIVARLQEETRQSLLQLLRAAATEPVTTEKAKLMLVMKSLVGLTKVDLGEEGDILNRIQLEGAGDPEEEEDGEWIT